MAHASTRRGRAYRQAIAGKPDTVRAITSIQARWRGRTARRQYTKSIRALHPDHCVVAARSTVADRLLFARAAALLTQGPSRCGCGGAASRQASVHGPRDLADRARLRRQLALYARGQNSFSALFWMCAHPALTLLGAATGSFCPYRHARAHPDPRPMSCRCASVRPRERPSFRTSTRTASFLRYGAQRTSRAGDGSPPWQHIHQKTCPCRAEASGTRPARPRSRPCLRAIAICWICSRSAWPNGRPIPSWGTCLSHR